MATGRNQASVVQVVPGDRLDAKGLSELERIVWRAAPAALHRSQRKLARSPLDQRHRIGARMLIKQSPNRWMGPSDARDRAHGADPWMLID
jgi:hypothetical protein